MANTDLPARRKIRESLVTGVALYPGKALISGFVLIDDSGLRPPFRVALK